MELNENGSRGIREQSAEDIGHKGQKGMVRGDNLLMRIFVI
jgi:hypothetical protein